MLSRWPVFFLLPTALLSQTAEIQLLHNHGIRSLAEHSLAAREQGDSVEVRAREAQPLRPFLAAPDSLLKASAPSVPNVHEAGYESLASARMPELLPGEHLWKRTIDGSSTLTLTDRGVYAERGQQSARFLSHGELWGEALHPEETLQDLQLAPDRSAHRWILTGNAVRENFGARLLLAVSEDSSAAQFRVYSYELEKGSITGGLRIDARSLMLDVSGPSSSSTVSVDRKELYSASSPAQLSIRQHALTTIPTLATVSPSSGSGTQQAFTFSFTPPGTSGSLSQAQILFNDHIDGSHSCYIIYIAGSNSLGLTNDTGSSTTYQTLSSNLFLTNSQCSISSPFVSGNQLSFTVTFYTTFSGVKSIYVYDVASDGTDTGWEAQGAWTIPSTNSGVIPLSAGLTYAPGSTQSFSFGYRDIAGAQQIRQAQVLINSGLNGVNACYFYYDFSRAQIGLLSDDGRTTSWIGVGPGFVSNSQCSFTGQFIATSQGTDFTLRINISFTPSFGGAKNIYMLGQDAVQSSNWFNEGTLVLPGTAQPPQVSYSTPIQGSGLTASFTVLAQSTASTPPLDQVQLLLNTGISGTGACYVLYTVSTNILTLVNDSGSGGSQLAANSSGSVSNSQCTLTGGIYTASGGLGVLTINLTFSRSFGGNKIVYGYASAGGLSSGYTIIGNWSIPSSSIPTFFSGYQGTVFPGTSPSITIYWEARNAPLDTVQFIIAPSLNGVNSCYAIYQPRAGIVGLVNDAGTSTATAAISTSPTFANSRCEIDVSNFVSVDPDASTGLFVVYSIAPFHGLYHIYGLTSSGSLVNGWQVLQSYVFP